MKPNPQIHVLMGFGGFERQLGLEKVMGLVAL
jgi:hypothetical protein